MLHFIGDAMAYTERCSCFMSWQAVKGVPPVCFLSGLSGEELMMVVRAFPEAGEPLPYLLVLHLDKMAERQS